MYILLRIFSILLITVKLDPHEVTICVLYTRGAEEFSYFFISSYVPFSAPFSVKNDF